MEYQDEGLTPDFNFGGEISFGSGGVSGKVSGGVAGGPTGCVNCGTMRGLYFSLPIILVILAVLVLAFRR